MADIAIWGGSSTFTTGSTPFGFYDTDTEFQTDADKVSKFVANRLGYPLMDVELDSGSFYTCFEEAITTYGNEVFQYKIKENYLNLEGSTTGSSLNNQVLDPSLTRVVQISKHYGTEAVVGGNVTKYTGSLALSASQQLYDLDAWAVDKGISGSIEVRKVFYEAPPAIQRYFDPYAGTGTGIQSLMSAFDFGSFSPGINFMMMPISYDVALLQGIEFNDQIRKSSYSFTLVNNKLRLFPNPTTNYKLWFDYILTSERDNTLIAPAGGSSDVISDYSNVPYDNMQYKFINDVGKQWIRKYGLALCKELLGTIRSKFGSVPIPNAEVTLDGDTLRSEATTEKEALVAELRETLEQTSRKVLLEADSEESARLQEKLNKVPLNIYIG